MISIRSCLKNIGGVIVVFCASFLTFLFQSFRLDLQNLDTSILNEQQSALYDSQIALSNMILIISGGVLTLFALVTLFFSIIRFIKNNGENMGILKAMGYRRERIAVEFTKYSINAFIGSLLAFIASLIFSPLFYREMNADNILPDINMSISPLLVIIVLIVPSFLFALVAFIIALIKLSSPPLDMIKGKNGKKYRKVKEKKTFIKSLRSASLKNHISLIIFVGFSALCFGASVQMSFSLDQIGGSPLFFWLMLSIGLLLGISILCLAFGFAFTENKQYITLLKAYGYDNREIMKAIYSGYILVSVIGFIFGTVYQYGLLILMINIFIDTTEIKLTFSFLGLAYTLLIYIPVYILVNFYYFKKLQKLPLKNAFE